MPRERRSDDASEMLGQGPQGQEHKAHGDHACEADEIDGVKGHPHGCSPRNIYALITLCNPGCLSKSERTSSSSSGKQACSHRYRKRLLAF